MSPRTVSNYQVVFFYPAIEVGGAQLLFARVAEWLIKQGYDVRIIDIKDGFLSRYLVGSTGKFKLDTIELKTEEPVLYANEIIVLPASHALRILGDFRINDETRMLFWDLHPYNFIELLGLSFYHKRSTTKFGLARISDKIGIKRVSRFINKATSLNGLVFMSGKNFRLNKHLFDITVSPSYLSIPYPVEEEKILAANQRILSLTIGSLIRFAWLGRLDDDKLELVKLIMNDLEAIVPEHNVELHIIGDGSAKERLEISAKGFKLPCFFPGRLSGEGLSTYLEKNVDVGVALGTSALEFAARGFPSLVTPGVDQLQEMQKSSAHYIWLSECENYDLAGATCYTSSVKSIKEVIIKLADSCKATARECFVYLHQNHSLDEVGRELTFYLETSKLTKIQYDKIKLSKLSGDFWFMLKNTYAKRRGNKEN